MPFPPGPPGAPAGCCVRRVRSCPGLWHCRTFRRHKGVPPLPTPVSAYPPFSSMVLSFEVVFSQRARRPADPFRLLAPLPARAPAPGERSAAASPAGAAARELRPRHPSGATVLPLTLTSLVVRSLPSPLRWLSRGRQPLFPGTGTHEGDRGAVSRVGVSLSETGEALPREPARCAPHQLCAAGSAFPTFTSVSSPGVFSGFFPQL